MLYEAEEDQLPQGRGHSKFLLQNHSALRREEWHHRPEPQGFPPLVALPLELNVRKESLHERVRGQSMREQGKQGALTTVKSYKPKTQVPPLHNNLESLENVRERLRQQPFNRRAQTRREQNSERYTVSRKSTADRTVVEQHTTVLRRKVEKDEEKLRLRGYYEAVFLYRLDARVRILPAAGTFKAYIGEGNNSTLVKCCLKSRPWWSVTTTPENAHLVWTEWKKKTVLDRLPSRTQVREAEPVRGGDKAQTLDNRICIGTARLVSKLVVAGGAYLLKARFAKGVDQEEQWARSLGVKLSEVNSSQISIYNHVEGGLLFHQKKSLLRLLTSRYGELGQEPPFPPTFNVGSVEDQSFQEFVRKYEELGSKVWILKPGENSNQGHGIAVCDKLSEVEEYVGKMHRIQHTVIIQHYIAKPLLFKKRKFDIRCYLLVTSCHGLLRGYWYEQLYARTSSREFSLADLADRMAHLTNDAVQKKHDGYGKHEPFNKVSLEDLTRYYEEERGLRVKADVLPQMKRIARELLVAAGHRLDPSNKAYTFELFGLDFMLKHDGQPLIIEANSNPCLDANGPVLGRLIPQLIEAVLRVAVDPLFPLPEGHSRKFAGYEFAGTKFQLLYHSEAG